MSVSQKRISQNSTKRESFEPGGVKTLNRGAAYR